MKQTAPRAPKALLFISRQCPHCPGVLHGLSELMKQGKLRELQIFSIEHAHEEAQTEGVRSVPWIRIGRIQLSGAYSLGELRQWVDKAETMDGYRDYIATLIKQGDLSTATAFLQANPEHLQGLSQLLMDTEAELSLRIGAAALVEDLVGSEHMGRLLPSLLEMSQSSDPRLRADAAHYLGISGDPRARADLQRLANDIHPEVAELARDALEEWDSSPTD